LSFQGCEKSVAEGWSLTTENSLLPLPQQWRQRGQQGAGDDFRSFRGGVNAVGLDRSRHVDQVFVDHGHEGRVVLARQVAEDLFELRNVFLAVVGRQSDSCQQDFDVGAFKRREHLVEIAAGLVEGQAAQTVVAAELDEHHLRMQSQNRMQARHGVLGGGAAGALVFHDVAVVVPVQIALQSVGERLPALEPVASGDTVAVAGQDRPVGGLRLRDERRSGQKRQEKRDEKRTANVHISSVRDQASDFGRADRVIEVRDAKKWIQNGARRVEILKGITLTIPAGQFVAIVGASGSGKSTLLGLLAGLDTPSSGEIWLDGVPIHNLAEADLAQVRGAKIGFVFQSYQLIATLTALENVLLPYELNLEGSGLARARKLLEEVGLGERVDHYPIQLSGGEQQRVALARAFVVEPPIVMADEPTGNLDSANGKLVLDLLLDRNRRAGTTLVLVTHDPEVASRADRRIVLKDGAIVEDSLPFEGASSDSREDFVQDEENNG